MNTTQCNFELIQQSLTERLSEEQEEILAAHLETCVTCRAKLEDLAADRDYWRHMGNVLRDEMTDEDPGDGCAAARLLPQSAIGDDDEDGFNGHNLKSSDFIVDFLSPSDVPDSLGQLGDIEIRAFIGQGAHGVVLKGFQQELNRLVAVKVMVPHLAMVVAARKRFTREARATAAIVHPNVMPILHVDSSGQLPFLVMPYVDCESLQERIDREGTLPLVEVLRIAVQVAKGLAAAHAQGLVHRDVKPANILLERGVERVMLTDFGLARAIDDATLTRSGLIAGTPHYMSPEQARGETVNVRSDLFSLGSVLYTMTTGRPPFRAETIYGILRRVTDDAPRPMRELNPDVPDWYQAIVMKLLAKSPAERFESADQVAGLLEDSLSHLQQPDLCPLTNSVRDLLPKEEAKRINRNRLILLAVVILLSIVGSFCAWSFTHEKHTANQVGHPDKSDDQTRPDPSSAHIEPTHSTQSWDDGIDEQLREVSAGVNRLLESTSEEINDKVQLPSNQK